MKTSVSPAEAEVYALSEAMRDAKHVSWVAQEMGVGVKWPLQVNCDNAQAVSFQREHCARSKLKGCFGLREDWVGEMRDLRVAVAVKVPSELNKADMLTKCFANGGFNSRKAMVMGG
jgi:hypothetical protein